MASFRRVVLVRLCTLAFIRAKAWSGHLMRVVYRSEHAVIGPANHIYTLLDVVKVP